MKKIIIFLIILLILISCKPVQRVKTQTGINALKIDFLSQAPPFEVHEKEKFNIIAEIKNIGTHNIEKGIFVVDVDDQYVDIKNNIKPFSLEGKSNFNPAGGIMLLEKQATVRELPVNQQRMTTKISIGACFDYSTIGGIDVCIDTTPEKTGKKPCTSQIKNMAGGQGAPVAITRIEPKMLPSDDDKKTIPEFIVYFQNLGKGDVIKSEKVLLKCDPKKVVDLEREDYDLVDIKVSIPQGELKCNKQSISLASIERKIICKYEDGISKNLGAFTSSLNFELSYGYFQTEVKHVTISKA